MVTDRLSLEAMPFQLGWAAPHPALQSPADALAKTVENLLRLSHLNRIYRDLKNPADSRFFPDRALDLLDVRADIRTEDLAAIPRQGPVVVVANHPSGVIEGLLLMRLLHGIRPDVRVLLNSLLARVPECHDFALFVNPFGGSAAAAANRAGMKATLRWLHDGKVLLVFPAGEVARMNWRAGRAEDPPWNEHIARLVRASGAGVVPIQVGVANSPLFHLAGWVHPRLQTALLPQELLNKRHATIRVQIGRFIPAERLALFHSDAALTRYLRVRVDTLACRNSPPSIEPPNPRRFPIPRLPVAQPRPPAAIAKPDSAQALADNVAALSPDHTLLTQGALRVICAESTKLPAILPEIGRLREITFRGVGEGTGQSRDLDGFDPHYLHLFVWNDETREVVGAYRLGATDHILPRFGLRGFYTSTLFKYRTALMEHLHPALELGRSFVRPEYQRGYLPLLLLWKGIAHYLVRHPHYRKLFGPVSISNAYHPASRHLIQRHFPRAAHAPHLVDWVRPRHALRAPRKLPLPHLPPDLDGDLNTLTELIEDLERGQSLPVLLRQYLKLGGEVIAFNVDPAFNSALDALIVVDLDHAGESALGRYMGPGGWHRFQAAREAATRPA